MDFTIEKYTIATDGTEDPNEREIWALTTIIAKITGNLKCEPLKEKGMKGK